MTLAFRLATALLVATTPCAALAEVVGIEWRHPQSGVSLPLSFGEMRLVGERDLSNGAGYDVMAQFGDNSEPVTVYLYRSSHPNAALWFERIRHAMKRSVGLATDTVEPRTFTLAGSPIANGLREERPLAGNPQWKSTGVALAQVGEWLVKVRATSGTLDPAGLAARIDRVLAAMRFAPPPAKSMAKQHALVVPGPCGNNPDLRGQRLEGDLNDEVAMAAVTGIVVLAEARGAGGLAADPAGWCREDTDIPAEHASVYRERNGDGWVALVGDSGMTVSARPLEARPGDKPAAAIYANNPSATSVVALFDRVPDPDAAVLQALPVAAGHAQGLMKISVEPGVPQR